MGNYTEEFRKLNKEMKPGWRGSYALLEYHMWLRWQHRALMPLAAWHVTGGGRGVCWNAGLGVQLWKVTRSGSHTHMLPPSPDHTQGPLCFCQSINDSNTWTLSLVFCAAPVTHWHGKYTQTTVLPCRWTHHYCSPGVKTNKILFNPRGPHSSLEIHHPYTSSETFIPNAPKSRYKFSQGERCKKKVQTLSLQRLIRSHTSMSTKNPAYVCDIYRHSQK